MLQKTSLKETVKDKRSTIAAETGFEKREEATETADKIIKDNKGQRKSKKFTNAADNLLKEKKSQMPLTKRYKIQDKR